MNWVVKRFEELTSLQLYSILKLRSQVFVVEQNCAYQDLDDIDQKAIHLFTCKNDEVIAYARLIPPGISYETASIGRVVVSQNVRKTGIGKHLMNEAIKQIEILYGSNKITISAQEYLKRFYNDLGFTETGTGYLEDNIPHIKMKK